MNSPPPDGSGASAGSGGDSERSEAAPPTTNNANAGRRRRLQRRSVSANAVSDVFYRAYNSHHREATAPHRNDGIIIDHTYFDEEEDEDEELYHHNHEATSEHFGRAEHPLVGQHRQLQGGGISRTSGPSGAGNSQDANSNNSSIGSPLRRNNGASVSVRNRQSAGMTNRLTDTLGLIHPTSPGTRRRLLPRHGGGAPAMPSTYPPIVSPFRMMPTASNTALSRRIKNLFGIAVVLVVILMAVFEARG